MAFMSIAENFAQLLLSPEYLDIIIFFHEISLEVLDRALVLL